MNTYQKEQFDTITDVVHQIGKLPLQEVQALRDLAAEYLQFRKRVAGFLKENFSLACTKKCYESRLSACCSKEGIITFFADVVINILFCSQEEVQQLLSVLKKENTGFKCIYLGDNGCLWRVKPIVCEMFICDQAKTQIFGNNTRAQSHWESLEKERKHYTWPDRPVLFDRLEALFLDYGTASPLMYCHNSPGLLRVKQKAKLNTDIKRT